MQIQVRLARKASHGGETANLKELTGATKQRVKVRLNLIAESWFGSTYGSAENDLWSDILNFVGINI